MAAVTRLSTSPESPMQNISRRSFLLAAGAAATAPTVSIPAGAATAPSPGAASAGAAPARAYTFFNPQESAFIEAAVERLIPEDELGPGALSADVPVYIDRQLGGAWGAGERLYRGGPFGAGTPSQGYQLPYTPAELFRRALRAVNAELAQRGTSFARLAPPQQDTFLAALQDGRRDLGGVPSNVFFESLLEVTIEGYFSDPAYGGNRDMLAWRMIGFPGAYADYYELVDRHNVAYRRRPMSLAENGRGALAPHAHGKGG
jgi:gluconate 2-dehydrogenase gamma chain